MADQFSDILMDYFQNPRNQGQIQNPSAVGVSGLPGNGPFVVLHIKLDNAAHIVSSCRFQCHPCGVTIAASSIITELVTGKTPLECEQINTDQVIQELDGVPRHKLHVVSFVLGALKQALLELSI